MINIKINNIDVISLNSKDFFMINNRASMDFIFKSPYIFGIPERFDNFILNDTTLTKPYLLYNLEEYCAKIGAKKSVYGTVPNLTVPGKFGINNASQFWCNFGKKHVDLHR